MSQRDIREVTCDNITEHQVTPKTASIADGVMPTGWRHMTLFSGKDDTPLEFDACSSGCAATIAARLIRLQIYGMKE